MKKLLPLFILIFAFGVSGQTKKPIVKSPPTGMPVKSKRAPFVFNESVEALPTDFKGDSYLDLLETVNQLKTKDDVPVKNEFETTADYEKRVAELKQATIKNKFVSIINYQL